MNNEAPEGMIPVAEFGRKYALSDERVIEMIREGICNGRKVGDEWFVKDEEAVERKKSGTRVFGADENGDRQEVVVTDVKMPFWSMVVFMVKWAIASIPAFVILLLIYGVASSFIASLFVASNRIPY